jgi:hypothetical protein
MISKSNPISIKLTSCHDLWVFVQDDEDAVPTPKRIRKYSHLSCTAYPICVSDPRLIDAARRNFPAQSGSFPWWIPGREFAFVILRTVRYDVQ